MLGGEEKGRQTAAALLTSLGNIVDMGNDVGAANVVKLCGNFLIAVGVVNLYHCVDLFHCGKHS
jgi:3-hydroxyisobutyrate dehydrogenase-like beta-hydroxyacid dehydrogenase